jgi:hypothetical protein
VNAFEKEIAATFQDYRDVRLATLFMLHPPMRIGGMSGRVPCFVQVGKAPYDVAGFYYNGSATSIGAELKETRDRKPSLRIVGEKMDGSGLEYHQLDGLVRLHDQGGMAMLLWSNGGEIGRMDGQALKLAKIQYDDAVKRKNPPLGAKSLQWDSFKAVRVGHGAKPLWLPKPPKYEAA